jgi:phosphatidylserine/phosphatidylglycerophosphate/cardiolipin synthase-like enzyme
MDTRDYFAYIENEEIYQAVIVNGILRACESIDIATANVKDLRVPSATRKTSKSIVQVLREQAERGVKIRLLHSGVPSERFIESLKVNGPAKVPNFKMRRCPRVHFKSAVFDGTRGYLGSANLTGAGFGAKSARNRNFEMGLLVEDEGTIRKIGMLFNSVWNGVECTRCGRKKFCPVPLEEPDF